MQICYIFCRWDSTFKVEMFFSVVSPVCCVQCLSASYHVWKGLLVLHPHKQISLTNKGMAFAAWESCSWKGWRCLPESGNFIKWDFSWCPCLHLLLTSMAFVLFTAGLYVVVSKLCRVFQQCFVQGFSGRIFHWSSGRQDLEGWSEGRPGS